METTADAASGSGALSSSGGLRLHPIRGLRPDVAGERIATLLCPPYDVIDSQLREQLLETDADNAVGVILPPADEKGYAGAAARLAALERDGVYRRDDTPALYVYEMRTADGDATRGLLGAVELRAPDAGVILPHENTMAGPVADRLAVMTATGADLEPIYLVYDGGGVASDAVRSIGATSPVAEATTPDGITHRLWAIEDAGTLAAIAEDLQPRHALIADGHHRYATYLERQRQQRLEHGAGPWDRGLTLLVDSTDYGPQVHAIHRVVPGLKLTEALEKLAGKADISPTASAQALSTADAVPGFAVVVSDGESAYLVTDPDGALAAAAARDDELPALAQLDVTVVHRGLVERVWGLTDDVDTVRYAHSVDEALDAARATGGVAVLLRPTPVDAVAAVAAAGARMPRKSTFFTPKPASGLVMRRLADDS